MQFDENITTPPLISILHREHAKYLNEKVKKENLSYGLQPMLVTIYKNEGIIQEQLAKYYNLNESTITRNLKKLEEKLRKKKVTIGERDYEEIYQNIYSYLNVCRRFCRLRPYRDAEGNCR